MERPGDFGERRPLPLATGAPITPVVADAAPDDHRRVREPLPSMDPVGVARHRRDPGARLAPRPDEVGTVHRLLSDILVLCPSVSAAGEPMQVVAPGSGSVRGGRGATRRVADRTEGSVVAHPGVAAAPGPAAREAVTRGRPNPIAADVAHPHLPGRIACGSGRPAAPALPRVERGRGFPLRSSAATLGRRAPTVVGPVSRSPAEA